MESLALAIGRALLVAIFIQSGYAKLTAPAGIAGLLTSKGLPMPLALAYAAGAAEIGFGALILIGWKTRYAAAAMIVFVIVATYLGHDFWNMAEAARRMNLVHFMKNLSIIGGLLVLIGSGAGRYSVDRR
jgi:putative oxidoreductase